MSDLSSLLQVCLSRQMVAVSDADGVIYFYPVDRCRDNNILDSQLCVRAHQLFSGTFFQEMLLVPLPNMSHFPGPTTGVHMEEGMLICGAKMGKIIVEDFWNNDGRDSLKMDTF